MPVVHTLELVGKLLDAAPRGFEALAHTLGSVAFETLRAGNVFFRFYLSYQNGKWGGASGTRDFDGQV